MDETTKTVTCSTCGMRIDPATAAQTIERDGETHYFCSDGCATAFRNDKGE